MKISFGDKLRLKDGKDVKVTGVPYHNKFYGREEETGKFRVFDKDKVDFVHTEQLRLTIMESVQ